MPAAAAVVLGRYRAPQFQRNGEIGEYQCHTKLPNHTIWLLSASLLLSCAVCGKFLGTLRQISTLGNTQNHNSFSQYRYTVRKLCCYLAATNRAAYANGFLVDPVSKNSAFCVTAASSVCKDVKFVPVFNL